VLDSAGHPLGGPVQANVESGGGRYDAAVTALSDGGFVVAWQSQTGDYDGSGIFGRRFGADGSAIDQQEFGINQMRAGDQTGPDVVALANGGFAAAWVDAAAGGAVSVEARVFVAPGSPAAGSPADAVVIPLHDGAQAPNAGSIASTPAPAPAPASHALATAGNNILAAGGGAVIDGLDGVDTAVFGGARAAYSLTKDGTGYAVVDASTGSKTVLANIERLQFSDQSVALDVDGHAGQAYRLYQAAFNRVPDKAGLGFWIDALDSGHGLTDAAAGFIGSSEFASLYGSGTSDARFVQALYQNVLHRAPDASGDAFWLQALQTASRAQVLTDFSESAENKAQVIGAIQDGIGYAAHLTGTGGNDVMAASGGGVMDGMAGVDTVVFGGQRAAYSLAHDGASISVVATASASATTLANVERLQFSDQTVALDIQGNAGQAYRLYQAALGRTPDTAGLGFWINAMDDGHTLADVASSFIGSAEFAGKYGAHPSDADYVDALYANVLHRAADASGHDFWVHALQDTSRAQVLADFSESPENQAQVIGAIQDGIGYTL
jgi:hypothetical protein